MVWMVKKQAQRQITFQENLENQFISGVINKFQTAPSG